MRHVIKNFLSASVALRLRDIAVNSRLESYANAMSDSYQGVKNVGKSYGVMESAKVASPSMATHMESKLLACPELAQYVSVVFPYAWSYALYPKGASHDWHIDAYHSPTPQPVRETCAYSAVVCLDSAGDAIGGDITFRHGDSPKLELGDCLVFDSSSLTNEHCVTPVVEGQSVTLNAYAHYI